jgi:hypothetical protein
MSRAATSRLPTSSRNDSDGSSSRSDALYAAPLKMTRQLHRLTSGVSQRAGVSLEDTPEA